MNENLVIALENREKLRNEMNAKMTDLEDVVSVIGEKMRLEEN